MCRLYRTPGEPSESAFPWGVMAVTPQRSSDWDRGWSTEQCCDRVRLRMKGWPFFYKVRFLFPCKEVRSSLRSGTGEETLVLERGTGHSMWTGNARESRVVTFTRMAPSSTKLCISCYISFFRRMRRLVEEILYHQQVLVPSFWSLTYLFLKCHHVLIYPFHQTYSKHEVLLTIWLVDGEDFLSQISNSYVDAVSSKHSQTISSWFGT